MYNFKPAGCETEKGAPKQINYAICEENWDSNSDDDGFIFDLNDFNNNQNNNNGVFKEIPYNPSKFNNEAVVKTQNSTSTSALVASTPLLSIKKENELIIDFKQAIVNLNIDRVKLMIDENSQEINVNLVFNNGWSPLMYAVMTGSLELTKFFVNKGADVNFKSDRVTVLMCACACKRIDDENLLDIVKFLVENGADYERTDKYCSTPLMFASREGNLNVVRYLIGLGVNINQQDENGWTSLVYACNKGHIECVRELLKNGANANLTTFDRLYPGDVAQNNGHLKVHALIERYIRSRKTDFGDDEYGVGDTKQDKNKQMNEKDFDFFLSAIKMTHLKDIFMQNKINLKDLLVFNDEDLEKLGISDSKTRITILDELSKMHKENWKPGSLMPHRYTTDLTPQEISAMMTNISRHCDFIASTVKFIYSQTSIENSKTIKEYANSSQNLKQEIEIVFNSSNNLSKELSKLSYHVTKNFPEKTKHDGDLIDHKSIRSKNLVRIAKASLCIAAISIPVFLWKKFNH